MKKAFFVFLFAFLCAFATPAQQARRTFATTGVGIDVWVKEIGSGITYHQLIWNLSGSAATCQVELDYSNDGIVSAGQIISNQTCTTNGVSAVSMPTSANYVRIHVDTKSGTGSISVTYLGYTTNPSGGGSGTVGPGATGDTSYYSGTTTISPGTIVLDMAGITGSDLGARMNACDAALPAAGGVCKGDNLTGAQTLSTAVTTTHPTLFTFCGQAVTQTANVNFAVNDSSVKGCAGASTTFTKGANIDQFTTNASNNYITNLTLDGAKASFTGNGIVVNATGDFSGVNATYITDNIITNEAADALDVVSGTSVFINNNTITNWGLHAIQEAGIEYIDQNYIGGDGTATGVALLITVDPTLTNNYVFDFNSSALVDASASNNTVTMTNNLLVQSNGFPSLLGGADLVATGNFFDGGGAGGVNVNVIGNSIYSNNTFVSSGNDDVDVNGAVVVNNNLIAFSMAGASGKCGINIKGDTIGTRVSGNQITVNDSTNGDLNYGICDAPTGTHNLNIVVNDNSVSGVLSGGATADGFFLNNAANLNTSWSIVVQNLTCVHLTNCLKRVDTQNNKSTFVDVQQGDTPLDAGTGSTNDVLVSDNANFTFATLPTPNGNGSRIYCTDCTQTVPIAASGSGAYLTRSAGVWVPTNTSTLLSCGVLNTTTCVITGFGGTSGSATITWPAVAGTIANPLVFSNAIRQNQAGIGTTLTDSIELFNTTAAGAGAQQYSPSIHWQAQGWKTNATAGSQTLDYISYLSATQGSANPSGTLNFCPQVNGGGYSSNCLTLGSDGVTRSTSLGYWFGIENNQTGNFAILDTAPTVATSGCGTTGASIVSNNGTVAFKVNVGTTNSGTCTITLPAATTDWICSATDITTTSTTVSQTKSVPKIGSLTTQITLQNYTDISGTHAWVDSDVIAVSCMGE